jgi:hypothetical protein
MREIKFRAWHKTHGMIFESERFLLKDAVDGDLEFFGSPSKDCRSSDFEFMQFTGIKDKHGNEIYDGDIVVKSEYIWFDADDTPNYRGTVEWLYSQWQVIAHCVNPEKRGISEGINEV